MYFTTHVVVFGCFAEVMLCLILFPIPLSCNIIRHGTLNHVVFCTVTKVFYSIVGVQLINSAITCVKNLRSETEFLALLALCDSATRPEKRRRTQNPAFANYVVDEVITQEDRNDETELRRMYFSCIDSVCEEMNSRFGERNWELMGALQSLDPEHTTFLDVRQVEPLLSLSKTAIVESEYVIARQFLSSQMKESSPPDGKKWTTKQVIRAGQ